MGGHHGSILRYMTYFSTNTCSCNLSIAITGKHCSRVLRCYHGNKAKTSSFQEISIVVRC